MDDWKTSLIYLAMAVVMVLLNGFFVAAEFALVKVRGSQLVDLVEAVGEVDGKSATANSISASVIRTAASRLRE